MTTFERFALAELERKMRSARVVVVNGPRQAGKSWLLRHCSGSDGAEYRSLDNPTDLRIAKLDPSGFVVRAPDEGSSSDVSTLFIDEVQRGGNPLVLAIKAAVDLSDQPGQFVLAGSTRFLAEPRLSESLAGRARFVDLWTLSQAEIQGKLPTNFIDTADQGPEALADLGTQASPLSRSDFAHRLVRGGFPEAVRLESSRDRSDWAADYLRTVSQSDISELSRLSDRVDLLTVLRLLAGRTASELNISELANDAGLGKDTARRYLPLVEAIFLLTRIPAWSTSITSSAKRRPKVHLTDSGLAAWLANVSETDLNRPGHFLDGALVESFVLGELMKQQSWSQRTASLRHWHEPSGREVDLILDFGPNKVVGIEIKATLDLPADSGRHLAYLRDRLGPAFHAGVVLHLGDRVRTLGDRLVSMPISALWA